VTPRPLESAGPARPSHTRGENSRTEGGPRHSLFSISMLGIIGSCREPFEPCEDSD
jgi:hypothetical protein